MSGVLSNLEAALERCTNPARRVDLLNVLAANLRHDDLDRAWALNQEAERRAIGGDFAEAPYRYGLAECLYWRGKFHSIHKRYQPALHCFYQALEHCAAAERDGPPPDQSLTALYRDAPDQFLIERVNSTALHNMLGVTLTLVAQFADALQHYLQAWQRATAIHDQWILTLLCNNIGYLYRALDQPDEAEPYIQRGLAMVGPSPENTAKIRLRATMLDNYCWVASHQGRHDQAIAYGQASFDLYRGLDWSQGQAEILNGLGLAYQRMGDLAAALDCFNRAYAIAQAGDIGEDMIAALLHSGIILCQTGETAAALDRLKAALHYANAHNDLQHQFKSHRALSGLYERLGDYVPALEHHKQFHAIKETVFNERSDQRLSVLRVMHKVELAEQEANWYRRQALDLEAEIRQREQVQAELVQLATIDALTGLANRRHFLLLAQAALERAREAGRPIALVLFDIDFFKGVNDTYGHPAGDQILRGLARAAQATIRQGDLLGRYGGEEFAMLLPAVAPDEALAIAERLRLTLAQQAHQIDAARIAVTVSLGVAPSAAGAETLDELLRAADQALYRAKDGGRNRSQIAQLPA